MFVYESYAQLLRKGSLVTRLSIDPETFKLTPCGRDGDIISAERLSAGERQLLAIAMLWGLAKASGRPLPTAIDTPLGRLDMGHRTHLVEKYFPFASHQVLLLSLTRRSRISILRNCSRGSAAPTSLSTMTHPGALVSSRATA